MWSLTWISSDAPHTQCVHADGLKIKQWLDLLLAGQLLVFSALFKSIGMMPPPTLPCLLPLQTSSCQQNTYIFNKKQNFWPDKYSGREQTGWNVKLHCEHTQHAHWHTNPHTHTDAHWSGFQNKIFSLQLRERKTNKKHGAKRNWVTF